MKEKKQTGEPVSAYQPQKLPQLPFKGVLNRSSRAYELSATDDQERLPRKKKK